MNRTPPHKILSILLCLAMILGLTASGLFNVDTQAATVEEWKLVTDASILAAGDKIVIAAVEKNYALSTTQNSNNRAQSDITKTDAAIDEPSSAVQIITLEAGNVTDTFALNVGTGYLYAASSGNNYLKTETALSDNSSWKIEIDTEGVATIKAQGTNTRNWLRYNSSNKIFSCYKEGQADICIYRLTTTEVGEMVDTAEEYIDLGLRSVVPDDKLYLRYYFQKGTKATGDVSDIGMEYWDHTPVIGTDVPAILDTYATDGDGNTYFCIGGLTPHEMLDVQYYRLYMIMDGIKYYSEVKSFSLEIYHDLAIDAGIMTEGDALDELVDAAIAYGTAAKSYYDSLSA